jgi:uncharacterized protein (DUF302 family)
MEPSYGLTKHLPNTGYDNAVAQVTEALKAEGFGILTEIDVRDTLKKKLGVDFQRYVILGACNPPLAHRALSAERFVGLLLPCNVIVMEEEEGRSTVSIGNPKEMFRLVHNEALDSLVDEVDAKLHRVLERV